MIIPCIDLMGGEVVQLVGGRELALKCPLAEVFELFAGFPLIHVIDLDAAIGQGENQAVIREILGSMKARVGGGVRSIEYAKELIDLGVEQVIVGSSAFSESGINRVFLEEMGERIGRERIVVAVDSIGGMVAVKGWREVLQLSAIDVVGDLEGLCGGILCTNVDREGQLAGTDIEGFFKLRAATQLPFTAAGGITTMDEVRALVSADIQVALGMAVYTGRLDLGELRGLI
ncbi:MAG: HisA/HisF-related TIM barrel protein [Fimbriimonadaceae bacterium]